MSSLICLCPAANTYHHHTYYLILVPKLQSVLTKANYINKTDVVTLLETFGNFRNVCSATEQQMVLCPGIGEKKVKRLHRALHAPFMLGGEEEFKDLDIVDTEDGLRSFYDQRDVTSTTSCGTVDSGNPQSASTEAATTGNFIVPPHPSTTGKQQKGKIFDPSSCTYIDVDR